MPLFLLLLGALFCLYSGNVQRIQTNLSAGARSQVRIADNMLRMELSAVVTDLQWLSRCEAARSAASGTMTRGESATLIQFVRDKRLYDQIRYLDITGMELFRVNYNDGNAYKVCEDSLQFKGTRYYVAEGLKLMADDIYISPLDLNVENGEIEQPLKPMIRFVTPVQDVSGARMGLAVVNYLGKRLLDVFDNIPSNVDSCMMLLNDDGYWLRCPTSAMEWGFMFDDRKHLTFQSKYPDVWKIMSSQDSGQFMTDHGQFTFSTIQLADIIVNSKTANPEHSAGSWKIVSFIDHETFFSEQNEYAYRLAYVGAPGTVFLGVISLLVIHFLQRSRKAEESIIEHDASFARFVPKEFLRLVGKGSLMDVELSTSVQRDITVLFSDIRSYTTLSEGMTHLEVFTFLNDYFVNVSKPVGSYEGFIDIFIGDALMALFPRSPEDALNAAIAMRFDLHQFNEERRSLGMPSVHCGYGLHFGGVTLGTIGTPDRMQTTAIGDTVNLASRIESVTKTFKVEIVISDDVYNRLPDPASFLLREIDTVRVKGKHEPVTLYECFDVDPRELSQCKAATRDVLAEGMALYKAGDFDNALDKFTACAEACPADSIPPIYIKRCNTMKRIPPGEGWAGISTL